MGNANFNNYFNDHAILSEITIWKIENNNTRFLFTGIRADDSIQVAFTRDDKGMMHSEEFNLFEEDKRLFIHLIKSDAIRQLETSELENSVLYLVGEFDRIKLIRQSTDSISMFLLI